MVWKLHNNTIGKQFYSNSTKFPLKEVYIQTLTRKKLQQNPAQSKVISHLESVGTRILSENGSGISRGLYIHGSVGSGKTMMMDMFHSLLLNSDSVQKHGVPLSSRIHFHQFMLNIHSKLHSYRKIQSKDPISDLCLELCKTSKVICLDEFQLTDIADAMILRRLFEALNGKIVLITTSNKPVHELYSTGLNRSLVIPLIKLLERQCEVNF
jgi:peroxisome-assembly ATPase